MSFLLKQTIQSPGLRLSNDSTAWSKTANGVKRWYVWTYQREGKRERKDRERRQLDKRQWLTSVKLFSSCDITTYYSLTSTSSPVVYINSLIKSIAAGSPHTWISSAQRPTQKTGGDHEFHRQNWNQKWKILLITSWFSCRLLLKLDIVVILL